MSRPPAYDPTLRAYRNQHGVRLSWGGVAIGNMQAHFAALTGDDE